jgi:cytoplasmic iron level regulating protein YaaA (DUF328/UPF0246 family)
MQVIYLVSCVSSKADRPCQARDLYQSEWFRRAKRYVESKGTTWYILSAEHGVLKPDDLVAPYERTLNKMPVSERRQWAERVRQTLTSLIAPESQVVVLAGKPYREFLMPYLRSMASRVDVPMEGLRIGEQLSWLGKQLVQVE